MNSTYVKKDEPPSTSPGDTQNSRPKRAGKSSPRHARRIPRYKLLAPLIVVCGLIAAILYVVLLTPTALTTGAVPHAPASLSTPTKLVFDDEFNEGALKKSVWTPYWFSNGNKSNETVMKSSNVSVGSAGLNLNLTSAGTGGVVSTNPDDGAPGHVGFQITPAHGGPVYIEWQATLPAASNGEIANWPALWLDGQNWPITGEIDVMEGLSGYAAWHFIWGTTTGIEMPASTLPGGYVNTEPGTHTYGVLWTTKSLTYVYDGQVVGTVTAHVTDAPMYLVMENSLAPANRPTPALLPTTMTVHYARVWQGKR
jgi:Glycosyl hydrolases family 16